jgi:hypothetical protein
VIRFSYLVLAIPIPHSFTPSGLLRSRPFALPMIHVNPWCERNPRRMLVLPLLWFLLADGQESLKLFWLPFRLQQTESAA